MHRPLKSFALLTTIALGLAACGNSYTAPGGGSPPPHGDINIVAGALSRGAQAFSPDTLTISLATSGRVVWANDDVGDGYTTQGTPHHIVSDSAVFDLGQQAPGSTRSFTFTAAGTYPFHCSIHPSMVGVVQVNP